MMKSKEYQTPIMSLFFINTVFIVLKLLVAAGSAKYIVSDATQTLNLVMKS